MSRCIFFYTPHLYAGILRFHSWITSHPFHCVSSSISFSNTHASCHQCLSSDKEYCFCLCEHIQFCSDFNENVVCLSETCWSISIVVCANCSGDSVGIMHWFVGVSEGVRECVPLCTCTWVCRPACPSTVHSAIMKCPYTKQHFGVWCV